ncbi:putative oxidoreductase [Colletotrichum trifolii]|uniref:Putative oxidoreductase n=1 Tax=Colletotrichum trifolii TaxID=5466 RepID=A0A4R8R0V7_COLTR|nr:putative oxidoreductase [Colletotrichum trifolii]
MNPANPNPYNLPADATWLITGCTSGIGKALAKLVASKPGHHLIATARNPSGLSYLPDNSNIVKLALDVTSPTSVGSAFEAAAEHFGDGFHIDVVVNNAGYSLSGATEAATEEEMHQEMETLFFGTARVSMKAVGNMRQHPDHRGGVIFNISSLAGQIGLPGHAYYHAGKWAVEGWSESVAREMHPDWNINFCIVEPAAVKTNFEGHSKARIAPHPAYATESMPARVLEKYVNAGLKMGVGAEPSAVAEAIYKIASRGQRIPLRVPLTATAWKMMKGKFESCLPELEAIKDVSAMGECI